MKCSEVNTILRDAKLFINQYQFKLPPGESITLELYCYHQFWAADAPVMAGEVFTVNDDNSDNRFYERMGRCSTIEEDVPPLHYLVTDYTELTLST